MCTAISELNFPPTPHPRIHLWMTTKLEQVSFGELQANFSECVNLQIQNLQIMWTDCIPSFLSLPSRVWSESWPLTSGLLRAPLLVSLSSLVSYLSSPLAITRLIISITFILLLSLSDFTLLKNWVKYCPGIQRFSGSVFFLILYLTSPRLELSNRTSCAGGNVLCLHWWLLSPQTMAVEELLKGCC